MSTLRKWVVMACLCMSGAVIYLLPYSTEVYYKPLQEALGVTNTEIGWLMSTLGVVNMLGYFPGGWLADRFSPRALLTFSLSATGAIGLYFATFPPYWMCFVVYAGWSLTSILTFWGALIKATRDWGGSDEQGRAFGILEGGRGVIRFALSSLGVAVLGWFADAQAGFSTVVSSYASLNIVMAIVVWLVLGEPLRDRAEEPRAEGQTLERQRGRAPAEPGERASEEGDGDARNTPAAHRPGGRKVLAVLKLPVVWLIALVIFCAYTMYLGSFYFTPYATDAFGLGVVTAGYLGAGKMILRPVSAAGAGFLGDRVTSSRVISFAFLLALVSFGLFAAMPSYSALLRLRDVPAPAELVRELRDPDDPVATTLSESLSEASKNELEAVPTGAEPPAEVTASLLNEINTRLSGELLYEPTGSERVALRTSTRKALLGAPKGELEEEERTRINRMIVEDALAGAINPLPPERARSGAPTWTLVLLVLNVLVATLCLYALRGIYYALLEEGNIPEALTGTTAGVVSVLGYTPDIFIPPAVGLVLDRFPGGVGYRFVYGATCLFCVAGLAATFAFIRRTGAGHDGPATSPASSVAE